MDSILLQQIFVHLVVFVWTPILVLACAHEIIKKPGRLSPGQVERNAP